jgi:methanogenic corrinoid protein MtbC1
LPLPRFPRPTSWVEGEHVEHETHDMRSRIIAELRQELLERLRACDKQGAVESATRAVTEGRLDITTLYRDVLTPLLVDTGAAWQSGEVSVWQEHLASAIVRSIVELLYPQVLEARSAVAPSGKKALLACPPGEMHELGLRMVGDRFEMAGWTTYFLGADTPGAQVIEAARSLGVEAVVLSSSTHFNRVALRTFVDQLRRELPDVRVWVGGPAFAHDRHWPADELIDLERLLGLPGAGGQTDEDRPC